MLLVAGSLFGEYESGREVRAVIDSKNRVVDARVLTTTKYTRLFPRWAPVYLCSLIGPVKIDACELADDLQLQLKSSFLPSSVSFEIFFAWRRNEVLSVAGRDENEIGNGGCSAVEGEDEDETVKTNSRLRHSSLSLAHFYKRPREQKIERLVMNTSRLQPPCGLSPPARCGPHLS